MTDVDAPVVVTAINIAPGSRLPVKAVESVDAVAGKGLVGDRYHGARHRQVTVQSASELARAAADLGTPIESGATRRNITVSHGDIPQRPGARIDIGDVELQVVRPAAPCRVLDDSVGPGAVDALSGLAGAHCRVLSGGEIRLGSRVELRP